MQEKPLYPFGYGLSYTEFSCNDLTTDREVLHPGDGLTLTMAVQNTGNRAGTAVVQVYVRAPGGTPNAQLKQIQHVPLTAGQAQKITLKLPPEAFTWIAEDGTPRLTPGHYTIYAGLSQPDPRSTELLHTAPCAIRMEMK